MDCTPEEQLQVLRWVAQREPRAPGGGLWDSDLMSDLAWPQEKAQSMLAGLRAHGDLACKDVLLEGGGGYSIGLIRLTSAGRDRLLAEDPQAAPARGLLAQLTRLVTPRRR